MTTLPVKRPRGRPRKAQTVSDDVRALLIRAGTESLTEATFFASGLEGILRRAGVPKGSFYHYFASKEAFALAVLDDYDTFFCHLLQQTLGDGALPATERLARFVGRAADGMARYQFQRGCAVGNLAADVNGLPESFRLRLNAILLGWQQQLFHCLQQAAEQGEIPHDTDCAQQAEFFWIGWEGAVMRARLQQSRAPLEAFLYGFLQRLTDR